MYVRRTVVRYGLSVCINIFAGTVFVVVAAVSIACLKYSVWSAFGISLCRYSQGACFHIDKKNSK